MLVRFIAHAGIHIEEGSFSAVVDPWFRGSSIQHPIIESAGYRNSPAIDFQIPAATEQIENYAPKVILLSHFHAHHAPLRDIITLIENAKEVLIAYPKLEEDVFAERLAQYRNVTLRPIEEDTIITHEGVRIKALKHTTPNHLAWYVEGKYGSVLHLADSRAHSDLKKRDLDPLWDTFAELKTDAVFLNMGGNCLRLENDNGPYVTDAYSFSSPDAANLMKKLQPKIAVPIGCYNQSLWATMKEYVPPSYLIEDQFYWALKWTAPNVRAVFLKPGETINLKEQSLFGGRDADYSIK